MEPTTKIKVINTVSHPVFVSLPDLRFSRTWATNGEYKVNFEVLQEGIYDYGFKKLIDKGILFIDDKAARIELGLEAEEAEDPPIKILTSAQLIKLLKATPIAEFSQTINELTVEQRKTLVDMALAQKNIDMGKADILKRITGIDIIKAIELKKLNEESDAVTQV